MSNRDNDVDRIHFMIDREHNPEKVIDFAIVARCAYRKAVLETKRNYGKNSTYRKKYIDSYLFHKNFIEMNSDRKAFECISLFYG